MENKKNTRTIKVDYLARVEGEGAMYVKIKDNKVKDVKLKIFEPPRFFEAFLRGRNYTEAPDITSRICGICPIAYQTGAVHAMEDILGIHVHEQIRALRRLIYCGEWIESHVLHIYMLHAPDFLGYKDSIQLAKDFPDVVKQGLKLKKIGNEIMTILGGREIHPVNIKVGGFYKLPDKSQLDYLKEKLLEGLEIAVKTAEFVSTFKFPDFEQDYEFVSLKHPDEYPITEGKLFSNKGLDIDIKDFNNSFQEEHVEHSNALHCIHKERGAYFVGPMARYNNNFEQLSKIAKETVNKIGFEKQCNNPFKSIIVRAIEVIFACEESIRIIDNYQSPGKASIEISPKAGTGFGCTEAPRGICFHTYSTDENGIILNAQIVPPTSQNQKTIEKDLFNFVSNYIDKSDDELRHLCEQAIRNYDPCISCATHFLKLNVERE